MPEVTVLPVRGEVFLDARDGDRVLRVSWHDEADVAVLSMWRGGDCVASFRLRQVEVSAFVAALQHDAARHSA